MYYVTMTDRFMSGWGYAANRDNKLIIECETWSEAQTVAENARNRSDQKYVNVCTTRPKYWRSEASRDEHNGYILGHQYVQVKTRDDMPRWFEKGAF